MAASAASSKDVKDVKEVTSSNIPIRKDCNVPGKACWELWRSNFEIDTKYVPIKAIGKGAYGVVCSAKLPNGDKVAIKKIGNAFENLTDARRTLREIKLLRHLKHENVIALVDVLKPPTRDKFNDVYLVYELMDTGEDARKMRRSHLLKRILPEHGSVRLHTGRYTRSMHLCEFPGKESGVPTQRSTLSFLLALIL